MVIFTLLAITLGFVLCLAVRNRLPLHVGGRVCSAAFQRVDVVDDVTGAGARILTSRGTWMFMLESVFGGSAALDLAVRIALNGGMRCKPLDHVASRVTPGVRRSGVARLSRKGLGRMVRVGRF